MDLTQDQAQTQLQEMMPLAEKLIDMTQMFLKKRGRFLPHGGEMNNFDQIAYVNAAPENDYTNSEEVLPLLHEGLQQSTQKPSTLAVGVCEYVFIGEQRQDAIKVLLEHRLGACFAVYVPFTKRLLRKPVYDERMVLEAPPEVGGWPGELTHAPFS